MKDHSLVYQRIIFTVFWIVGVFPFINDEFFTGMEGFKTALYLLCDAVLIVVGLLTLREKFDFLFVGAFTLWAFVSTVAINGNGFAFFGNGMRDFVGILFCIPTLRYFFADQQRHDRFIASFDRQLFYYLVLQAFCVLWQFLRYGSGDHGGGSLGNWYSGQISTEIFLISFYLMRKRIDPNHFLKSLQENFILIFLLFPTTLNETKISFIYLVLYFILLIPIDRKTLVRLFVVAPVLALLFSVAYFIYDSTTQKVDGGIFSEEYLASYFLLDDVENAEGDAQWNMSHGNGMADVPRVTKFMYLPILDLQEPGHVLTGFGVGQFKGASIGSTSQFATDYDWYLLGTNPYFIHVYLQVGVIGFAFVLFFMVSLFLRKPKLYPLRSVNIQLYCLAIFILLLGYNDMFRNWHFCIIFFTIFMSSWLPNDEAEPVMELPDYSTHD